MNLKILSSSACENATAELSKLRDNELKKFLVEVENFDEESDQLDGFYISRINLLCSMSLAFGTKYSKMDQVNLWKTAFKKFYLVHS